MGLLNLFSKKSNRPYKSKAINNIYELLFCDNIDLFNTSESKNYSSNILFSTNSTVDDLKAIAADKSIDARQRLLSYNLLTSRGVENPKELLGTVVEVGLPNGLDINHSEKLLAWEASTDTYKQLIEALLSESLTVVNQIGKWDKPRRPFSKNGLIRLTFLVSDGLYFGEGPFEVFQNDAKGGPSHWGSISTNTVPNTAVGR